MALVRTSLVVLIGFSFFSNGFAVSYDRVIGKERFDRESRPQVQGSFSFDQYHTLDEIFDYLDRLSSTSDLITLEDIGTTYEGRPIRLAKVTSPKKSSTKPAIWIDCGIYAKEWISPAACVWGLNYLTSEYGFDYQITDLIDNNDVYILPVLNADGYNYTWTTDRNWRKNRVNYAGNDCIGVDINRNYDDGHWGLIGASMNSCDERYAGPEPFSEMESSAVRDKITTLQKSQFVKAFFGVQFSSGVWLFPHSWTSELPPEADDLYRVSNLGVYVIKNWYGTSYLNGPEYSTSSPASGTALDWSYFSGIVQSYVIKLSGHSNFVDDPPAEEIIPISEEFWVGLIYAINTI